jgi:hypothetical protein
VKAIRRFHVLRPAHRSNPSSAFLIATSHFLTGNDQGIRDGRHSGQWPDLLLARPGREWHQAVTKQQS